MSLPVDFLCLLLAKPYFCLPAVITVHRDEGGLAPILKVTVTMVGKATH
jgi:hypothetical protein